MSTSLPRPALFGLLGVVLIAAMFMLTRKGGDEETVSPPPPAPSAQSSTTPATPGGFATPSAPGATTTAPGAPATPAVPSKAARESQSRELPAPVSKALKSRKVVVLLFWSKRGVDDRAVKSAVSGLPRHGGKVAVFTDNLKNLVRYTKITAGANVVQTPTLVVTNKQGEARVATGYLDPATVEQYVVDALHGAP